MVYETLSDGKASFRIHSQENFKSYVRNKYTKHRKYEKVVRECREIKTEHRSDTEK